MLVQKIELMFINLVKTNQELRKNIGQRITRKLGWKPANFYPEDVTSVSKHGRTGLYLITSAFNADGHSVTISFALKTFKSPEEAKRNRQAQQELVAKIHGTDILTARVLCQENAMLVYEGIEGEDYYGSALSLDTKLYLAGKALAAFHGPRMAKLDRERYQVVLEATLKMLPVPEDRRDKLRSNGWILINEVLNGFTGTVGYGDYHAGNLMFDYEEKVYLIDPEFKEADIAACRFEDIGTFFLNQGLRLMQQTKTLFLEGVFDKFLAGYEAYLSQFGTSVYQMLGDKNRIYAAFFFHLGLSSLLEALYTLRKSKGEAEGLPIDRITLCVSVANKSFKQALKHLGEPTRV
ncbi:MAG: phosphotransferase [Candidatus Odinarchaeota archaeon]